jgi:sulfur-oxidizing protein SoxY
MSGEARQAAARRRLLRGAGGLMLLLQTRPALAVSATDSLLTVVNRWAGGQLVREGRIAFDIAPLVENGNVVPISITVDSPMTVADHVREIVVFNERNPQRDVVRFTLSATSGRAQVDTRIRLATSQKLVALTRMSDGSQWARYVDVIVTLAACVEP